ncbi:GNAT family N-acetyltransferase [Fodinibius halophilus]|uniref:GNAT family N-acetyltransferase n=1 Tax=Fodinibius halophilus TaxID=1736908 RepID=A0A6M1T4H0_9BACT|nr:GNAT family N-acetyltransferase [Fodinibius halophilus]NGP87563.1 GNAT family N-acetyltransferase [Fodinibius halophilus]
MFCDLIFTFPDRENRAIAIVKENHSNDLIAIHGQEEVGRFQFAPPPPDDGYGLDFELADMGVNQEYQRAGIATKLMQAAVQYYHDFKLPARHHGPTDGRPENYLTPEGIDLVNHCFENDILPDRFEDYMPRTGYI